MLPTFLPDHSQFSHNDQVLPPLEDVMELHEVWRAAGDLAADVHLSPYLGLLP